MDDLHKSMWALLELIDVANRSLCFKFIASVCFGSVIGVTWGADPQTAVAHLKNWLICCVFVFVNSLSLSPPSGPALSPRLDSALVVSWWRDGRPTASSPEREKRYKKTRERLLIHIKANTRYSRERKQCSTLFCLLQQREGGREGGRWRWMARERVKEGDKQEKGEKNKSKRHYRGWNVVCLCFLIGLFFFFEPKLMKSCKLKQRASGRKQFSPPLQPALLIGSQLIAL